MPKLHPRDETPGARSTLRLRHKRLQAEMSTLFDNGKFRILYNIFILSSWCVYLDLNLDLDFDSDFMCEKERETPT